MSISPSHRRHRQTHVSLARLPAFVSRCQAPQSLVSPHKHTHTSSSSSSSSSYHIHTHTYHSGPVRSAFQLAGVVCQERRCCKHSFVCGSRRAQRRHQGEGVVLAGAAGVASAPGVPDPVDEVRGDPRSGWVEDEVWPLARPPRDRGPVNELGGGCVRNDGRDPPVVPILALRGGGGGAGTRATCRGTA